VSEKKLRTPLLSILYEQYLDSQDSAAFEGKVSRCYTPGTLQRLAKHHLREVRRAALLAIGFIGDYASNHAVGCALLDDDRTVRLIAANGIRAIWARAGDEAARAQLNGIVRLNAAEKYEEAIRLATELIEKSPWFAEAWHQRAAACFHLKQYAESIRDDHEALEINPYHFVAAASMGRAYLELENYTSALESLRRALRLNPDLEGVRAQVIRLARMVEDK